jgi:hypothetical protein
MVTKTELTLKEDVEKAVGLVAAEFAYAKSLLEHITKIEQEESDKATKDLRKGFRLLRWIARGERNAHRTELKVVTDLQSWGEELPAESKQWEEKVIKQLKVTDGKLVKAASRFKGDIRKELLEIETEEQLLEKLKKKWFFERRKIKIGLTALFKEAKSDIEQLEQWLSAMEAILGEIISKIKEATKLKILIIEDNIAEAGYAQTELVKAGFKYFKAVTNLSEGLKAMPKYDAVLSDLFFPVGNVSAEQYSQRFLPLYDQFKQRRFEKMEDNKMLHTILDKAKEVGVTPQEYVENIMTKKEFPPIVLNLARDALIGVRDHERYELFLKIEDEIRTGTNLPLGIIASERATELGIPLVIVTSTWHHNDAFEPVRDLIKVPYCDNLIDGTKNWKGAIKLLLKRSE